MEEAASGGRDLLRQDDRAAAALHPNRELVVVHDRDLQEAAAFEERRAANELRLIAPGTSGEARPQVDERRGDAEPQRALGESQPKAAEDGAVGQYVDYQVAGAGGKERVGVEEEQHLA